MNIQSVFKVLNRSFKHSRGILRTFKPTVAIFKQRAETFKQWTKTFEP